MTIETIALIKLPAGAFAALPRAGEAPSDPSRVRLKAPTGPDFEARLLDDAALVYTPVPFGADAAAVIDTLWNLLGDALADHDDDRGVFVLPSVARVGASTYDAVLEEIGEVGEWIALDDDEEADDDGEEAAAQGEVMAPGGDFMSMMASITNSLGADTLMSLQAAMMSGDAKAFERAQEAVAAKLSQRSDLVDQLQGLVGAMPPELRDMAMNTSPEQLMKQMKENVPPEEIEAMRKLSESKGRKG